MNNFLIENPLYFPVLFVLMWLVVTTILGFISGWFSLMKIYPNRPETPLLALRNQSGSLGGVSMNAILNINICTSGLQLGMMRIFGPFAREFFVPWEEIAVTRKTRFFREIGEITFGRPGVGKLTLPAEVVDRMARAAGNSWPESGEFPPETGNQAGSRIFKQWALSTAIASAFFIIVPRVAFPNGKAFPIAVAILFPAIVFGVASIINYLMRNRS